MTQNDKKYDRKSNQNEFDLDDLEPLFDDRDRPFKNSSSTDARRIRKIHPLGPRIVVRLIKDSNVTDSGLFLPEGSKQALQESVLAEVIEVASALDSNTEEETNVSGVPHGATVLIYKLAGVKVPWDEDLRVIETRDVLAVIDEISLV